MLKLALGGYVMFRKDRMGRRGGGVLLYTGLDPITQNHFNYNYFEISTSITITPP